MLASLASLNPANRLICVLPRASAEYVRKSEQRFLLPYARLFIFSSLFNDLNARATIQLYAPFDPPFSNSFIRA